MIVSTKGIVLKAINYKDTSKIVEVFTESDGVVALIAKGVRKQTKVFGVLEPLNIIHLSFYKKTTQDLFLLSKAETISSYQQLLNTQITLIVGLAILELVKYTQVHNNPNKYIYNLTINCIETLKSKSISPYLIMIYFFIQLTKDLGIDVIEKIIEYKYKNFDYICFNTINGEIKVALGKGNFPKISKNTVDLLILVNELDLSTLKTIEIISINFKELIVFFEYYISFYLGKTIKINILYLFDNVV
ncbi:MAG: DNA repair protein RecO [Candidatus Kapaibacteriota bacterium]